MRHSDEARPLRRKPRKLFFIPLAVCFVILIPFYFQSLVSLLSGAGLQTPAEAAFWISFAGSTLLFLVFLKKSSFLAVFEHEFTHLFWGLLFFKKPRRFIVKAEREGQVEMRGNNFIITLSPYFSPTLNLLFLPLYYVIDRSFAMYFFVLFGILLGYHTASTLKETHRRQPDLTRYGFVFSFIFLVFANTIAYGAMFAFAMGRESLVLDFFSQGIENLRLAVENLVAQ